MDRDFPGSLVEDSVLLDAEGTESIPGQGTKIRFHMWCGQKQTNKQKSKMNKLWHTYTI